MPRTWPWPPGAAEFYWDFLLSHLFLPSSLSPSCRLCSKEEFRGLSEQSDEAGRPGALLCRHWLGPCHLPLSCPLGWNKVPAGSLTGGMGTLAGAKLVQGTPKAGEELEVALEGAVTEPLLTFIIRSSFYESACSFL